MVIVGTKRKTSRKAARAAAPEVDGRERILEAAIRSFAERGFAGTTTAGVARDAGVTQPLVHHHFGSKEGLWRAAIDHLFAEIPLLLATDERPPFDGDAIFTLVARFVRLSSARPEIARIVAREGAAPSSRLTYLIDRHVRGALDYTMARVREAQRAGVIARELRPELLLVMALGAGAHLFDVPALAKQALGIDIEAKDTRDAFVAVFHRVLTRGVLASPPR